MKLTGKEKVSYGLGAVGKDMVYMLSASYILYYYQDILGVSAFAMGVILLAARVINTPVKTPVTLLVVIAVKILRSLSPATFCKPSLIIFIPYRKSPNEPMSFKKS